MMRDENNGGLTKGLFGLAVFATDTAVTPLTNSDRLPAIKFTLNEQNAMTDVILYVNDQYTAAKADNSIRNLFNATGTGSTENSVTIDVNRGGTAFFGFTSDYMARVNWTDGNITGVMIAGIETADVTNFGVPTIKFTGKGTGKYRVSGSGGNTTDTDTIFTVTAEVDEENAMITFDTTGTCVAGTTCSGDNKLDDLNITAASTSYADNEIRAVASATGLSGTLDARFYGGGNYARELGGVFLLNAADKKSYYFGAFGAKNDGSRTTVIGELAEITATETTEENLSSYLSLDAASDAAIAQGATAPSVLTLQGSAVLLSDSTLYDRKSRIR